MSRLRFRVLIAPKREVDPSHHSSALSTSLGIDPNPLRERPGAFASENEHIAARKSNERVLSPRRVPPKTKEASDTRETVHHWRFKDLFVLS